MGRADVSHLGLYLRYAGQGKAQPTFAELDCESGSLTAQADPEIGAVPEQVRQGLRLRWAIPLLSGAAANRLLSKLEPYARRVVAGADDASWASETIEDLCRVAGADEDDLLDVWEAADWLADANLKVTKDTTDAELDAIEEDLRGNAALDGIDVLEGVGEHLRAWRDDPDSYGCGDDEDESAGGAK